MICQNEGCNNKDAIWGKILKPEPSPLREQAERLGVEIPPPSISICWSCWEKDTTWHTLLDLDNERRASD